MRVNIINFCTQNTHYLRATQFLFFLLNFNLKLCKKYVVYFFLKKNIVNDYKINFFLKVRNQ